MIRWGKWSEDRLDALLRAAAGISGAGRRIAFLSGSFLGAAYREATLSPPGAAAEELTINLEEMDCFTFIDSVEAMRLSSSFQEFARTLERVRYRAGLVSYASRNHFFTDWPESNAEHIADATPLIGERRTVTVQKRLNEREDGALLLPGIPTRDRTVSFIPSGAVDEGVVGALKTGDYLGIYSGAPELDVSHVGIFIRTESMICLRHASSAQGVRKVVDQDFRDYLRGKPGIVVLRPRE
ncbi:MAG: DUF1460 domain-containing protein [Thermodesulfovibrionales bacterium]